nr:retrotransposon protein, putative, Ty1-copia subclass [Tanacetum cinerariifolium]
MPSLDHFDVVARDFDTVSTHCVPNLDHLRVELQSCLVTSQIESKIANFVETLLCGIESLTLKDVLSTLNLRVLKKRTDAKDDGDRNKKKSTRFVKKNARQGSGMHFEGHDNDDLLMAVKEEMFLELIMDSGGSYHMTPRRDFLFNFKEFNGGTILVGDNRACAIRGTKKVRVKMKDGTIKENYVYSLNDWAKSGEASVDTQEKESLAQVWLKFFGYISEAGLHELERRGVMRNKGLEPDSFMVRTSGELRDIDDIWLCCLKPRAIKCIFFIDVVFNEILMYKHTLKGVGVADSRKKVKFEVELQGSRVEPTMNPHTRENPGNEDEEQDNEEPQQQYLDNYILVRDRVKRTTTIHVRYRHERNASFSRPSRFREKDDMAAYVFSISEEEDTREPITFQEAINSSVKDEVILTLAACEDYELEQLDVKKEFLHGNLEQTIYMRRPLGFEEGTCNKVCLLKKSLYIHKKSPRQWYKRFDVYMVSNRFSRNNYDSCVYFKEFAPGMYIYLLLICWLLIKARLKSNIPKDYEKELDMKELGPARKILGMEIVMNRGSRTLKVSQSGYVHKITNNFRVDNRKSVSVPLGAHFKHVFGESRDQANHVDVDSFVDVDYAKDPNKDRLIIGYLFMLKCLLIEPGINLRSVVVNGDNQEAIHISRNAMFHERTKHINVRYHFIREIMESKEIKVVKINTKDKAVDAFTNFSQDKYDAFYWIDGELQAAWYKHAMYEMYFSMNGKNDASTKKETIPVCSVEEDFWIHDVFVGFDVGIVVHCHLGYGKSRM